MMRRSLPFVLLLIASAASAAEPLRLGADLGMLLHEEASGVRSPLPNLDLRVEQDLSKLLRVSLDYGFSFQDSGSALHAFSQYHRLRLRPELALPVGTHALILGAGPAVALTYSTFSDQGKFVLNTSHLSPGASALAALDVRLPSTTLRAGFELLWIPTRVDLLIGVGASFNVGPHG